MKADTFSEHRVIVGGLSTLYLEAGTGPVLLLLHGNVTTFRSWRRIAAEFQTTHRVLAPALPGYGNTSPLAELSLDGMVSFLADFLDVLSIDKAILLGHSAGGLLAGAFALAHPERVTRLVLANSAGLGRAASPFLLACSLPPDWVVDLAIAALLLPGSGIARALIGGFQLRRPWSVTTREWRDQIRMTQTRTLLSTSFRAARMAVGLTGQRSAYRIDDRLGELRMPTLLIWGLTDELYPFWQGVRAARKIRHGRSVVLVSAGHISYLDNFVEFVDVLSTFVRDELHTLSMVDGTGPPTAKERER